MKRNIIVYVAILALAFVAGQNIFAQTTGRTDTQNLENQIAAVNQVGQEDLTALLERLGTHFNVEVTVLQDLTAQGYMPGQIWLALEITKASPTTTLADAIVMIGETKGHGWGVLAHTFGIAPGSADFHALKQKLGVVNGEEKGKPENEKGGNGVGKGGKS